jgi:hypothetical protein
VHLNARPGEALPRSSVFPSVRVASEFFAAGAIGYSPGLGAQLDGLQLCAPAWCAEPLDVDVDTLISSHFADVTHFPPGSVAFDSALIMRNVPHRWLPVPPEVGLP